MLKEIKNTVLKFKAIERQFDFFVKENEIEDPLFDLKNEIKNFLSLLRDETFSNSLVEITNPFSQTITIPKDISSAMFFICLALLNNMMLMLISLKTS